MKDYVAKFDLEKFINCSATVYAVERGENSKDHVVTVAKRDGTILKYECDAVAICTGLHVTPRIPNIIGIERVPLVLHSSEMKSREQFGQDTEVVILGGGETAMDAAHLAITTDTKSVTLCNRAGFYCAPKVSPTPAFCRRDSILTMHKDYLAPWPQRHRPARPSQQAC